ncbi:helix-turn-helix domain-containing protein [Actinomadura terrae]|uniref:helix-turn-helix domain-containing protein n=1 Tax=Actinomadura terrae TaxID=604353 RepID=UPI001FA73F9D|nr:helix-turn-helix domain-containing protein [Actinomadura terrae]
MDEATAYQTTLECVRERVAWLRSRATEPAAMPASQAVRLPTLEFVEDVLACLLAKVHAEQAVAAVDRREACRHCGAVLPPSFRRGRPRVFCSDRCSARARQEAAPRGAARRGTARPMPPHYLKVLQLRREHPQASLSQLAARHAPAITKHALAGRLRRARELAELLDIDA